jgi:hypothetical protein
MTPVDPRSDTVTARSPGMRYAIRGGQPIKRLPEQAGQLSFRHSRCYVRQRACRPQAPPRPVTVPL